MYFQEDVGNLPIISASLKQGNEQKWFDLSVKLMVLPLYQGTPW